MRTLIYVTLLAFAGAGLTPGAAAQQQAQHRARVPALVALFPELQGNSTPYRLARFGGSAPRDVILLSPDAGPATLTLAVETLLAARRAGGDVSASDALLRARPGGTSGARRVLPWADRVLTDVRAAAPRQIPGIGRVRAVQIWLPAQRGQGQHTSGSGS